MGKDFITQLDSKRAIESYLIAHSPSADVVLLAVNEILQLLFRIDINLDSYKATLADNLTSLILDYQAGGVFFIEIRRPSNCNSKGDFRSCCLYVESLISETGAVLIEHLTMTGDNVQSSSNY